MQTQCSPSSTPLLTPVSWLCRWPVLQVVPLVSCLLCSTMCASTEAGPRESSPLVVCRDHSILNREWFQDPRPGFSGTNFSFLTSCTLPGSSVLFISYACACVCMQEHVRVCVLSQALYLSLGTFSVILRAGTHGCGAVDAWASPLVLGIEPALGLGYEPSLLHYLFLFLWCQGTNPGLTCVKHVLCL